jgi:hypothetical protein
MKCASQSNLRGLYAVDSELGTVAVPCAWDLRESRSQTMEHAR